MTDTSTLSARTLLGLALTAIGLALLGDTLGVLDADRVLRFWPLVLVGLGVVFVLRARDGGPWFPGAVLILVGGAFLLEELGYLEGGLDRLWPLIVVLLGIAIMSRGLRSRRAAAGGSDTDGTLSKFAFLSGFTPKVTSRALRGGNLSAFMGGLEVDLTDADIEPGTEPVFDVFVLMGGIELRVPRDWTVDARVTPFMGGLEDSSDRAEADPAKRLVIKGFVMMGGLEIDN